MKLKTLFCAAFLILAATAKAEEPTWLPVEKNDRFTAGFKTYWEFDRWTVDSISECDRAHLADAYFQAFEIAEARCVRAGFSKCYQVSRNLVRNGDLSEYIDSFAVFVRGCYVQATVRGFE